jgi:hypothetical protein
MKITGSGKTLAVAIMIASTFFAISAWGESKVRIVRLSDVEGAVQMERAAGEGLEKAFLNLPIVEGSRVRTGKEGRAEIEFEDGSTVRLGPYSELSFTRLALGADGQKLNSMHMASGTFYAKLRPKKGDEFGLSFAQESITASDPAHFRVVMDGSDRATVAVFKGKVNASGPAGEFEVAEKHSATINLANADPHGKNAFVLAKNYDQDPLDGWDRRQNDYHERYTSAGDSNFSSPYGYGLSDLNYYGTFGMIPGYGYAWQPFFANAAWNPFMDGAWAFYPGMGYMWVSGYPWGWMPYLYGTWAMAPGYGWIWQPGTWNSWNAVPRAVNNGAAVLPTAPASGHQTMMVGKGLMANATDLPERLKINPGSAGFGVPRDSISHLDRVARTMDRDARPHTVWTQPPTFGGGFGMPHETRGMPLPTAPPATHAEVPRAEPHK